MARINAEPCDSSLINNKEKAFEMGQNGKAAVLSEYNWYSQESLYLEIFQKYSAN